MCGRILCYSLINGQLTEMPGRHKHGTRILNLAALHGKVSHNWLISSIGRGVHSSQHCENDDVTTVDNESIACQVLVSLGTGYHEMFKSESEMAHQQHILTWCF